LRENGESLSTSNKSKSPKKTSSSAESEASRITKTIFNENTSKLSMQAFESIDLGIIATQIDDIFNTDL
jgi:hypothetical protein